MKHSLCTQNTSPARTLISPALARSRHALLKCITKISKQQSLFSALSVFFTTQNTPSHTENGIRKTYGGEAALDSAM